MDGILANRFDYLYRIWKLRYFWGSLVQQDLHNRYRGSYLGVGWSLLRPLSMTCIFCTVFAKLFNVSVAEYAPFLLVGMTTWQFFTESLLQGCKTFVYAREYIRQQSVPLAIYPLRTVLGSGLHGLIALGLAIAVSFCFRGALNPLALLYLIPGIAYLFLLGWVLAIVTGFIYTHFPDMDHMLELGLQILFYVTPILYLPESLGNRGRMSILIEWNPLTSVLALIRAPILEGTAPAMHNIQISLLFLAVIAGLAILLLRKLERTLVFWL